MASRQSLTADAVPVAQYLLGPRVRGEVAEIARKLATKFPQWHFVAKVIEHADNEEVKQIGRSFLESCDPHVGSIVANALLKEDPKGESPQIEKWLRKHWRKRDSLHLLQDLLEAAPLTVGPAVFEWLDAHPRVDNYDALLRTPLVFTPSQQYLDLLWSWGQRRLKGRQAQIILKLVLCEFGDLKVPDDAIEFADSWLDKNLDDANSFVILLRLLRLQTNEKRVLLCKEWLSRHSDEECGRLLRAISRHPKPAGLTEQALNWAASHPDDPASEGIVLQWQTQDPMTPCVLSVIDVYHVTIECF